MKGGAALTIGLGKERLTKELIVDSAKIDELINRKINQLRAVGYRRFLFVPNEQT
jgi:hypothetical protein